MMIWIIPVGIGLMFYFNLFTPLKNSIVGMYYVHKGDKLYIEGRIRYTVYDDKQGQRRTATEIWADNMEMLSPKTLSQPQEPAVTTNE